MSNFKQRAYDAYWAAVAKAKNEDNKNVSSVPVKEIIEEPAVDPVAAAGIKAELAAIALNERAVNDFNGCDCLSPIIDSAIEEAKTAEAETETEVEPEVASIDDAPKVYTGRKKKQ